MAGSRREAVGSLLSRMIGLLKSGAVKQEDRPIWYDIVKALPPKPLPPQNEVPKIVYPEDFVRVHFHRTFVETSPVRLTDDKTKSVSQRFVDTYLDLLSKKVVPPAEIFDKTVELLKTEGIKLQTVQEKQERDLARRQSIATSPEKYTQPEDDFTSSVSRMEPPPERSSPPKFRTPHVKVDLDSLYSDDKK
ncbi:unnamed protein product [Candidula unifasciata]|uniref:Small ribosomal subunit protein mS23 conserved domain-containing protein n=1 Tax=Candidula unifasciata TaxID=100452 RepID=A0A8S3ZTQ3_9EUPU|nr:unnamed protein product [Candidula unifasciata]